MKNINIIYHNATVTRNRRNQLNGHKSVVVWFTGLSGSGKSTLAHSVEESLYQMGCRSIVLDGDNVRHGLNSDLDFSNGDRKENLRRIGEVSKLFVEGGLITLTAFISPFIDDRKKVRSLFPHGDFLEIFVDCPIEACEGRDVKGLYKKARQGIIKDFTGINSPYEPPIKPELTIHTNDQTLVESVELVLGFLIDRGLVRDQR
jgi:adenylylsulfate kinase